jgi:hypothetical protein
MAIEPEREPESSGDSGVPVKLEIQDVPADWLDRPDHVELADRVDRLSGDVDLVTRLALEKYTGPSWDYVAQELAKYGMAVIASWIGRGLIFERCASKGLGGLQAIQRPFTEDENAELTGETVAKALHHFKFDVLMKNQWDHRRGATLSTYFIGQCLIRFANIYRSWLRGENRNQYVMVDDDQLLDSLAEPTRGPERQVVAGVTAERALSTVKDPRVRKAMHLQAAGWTQAEIADEFDVTDKAVERMLANERGRLTKRGIA